MYAIYLGGGYLTNLMGWSIFSDNAKTFRTADAARKFADVNDLDYCDIVYL